MKKVLFILLFVMLVSLGFISTVSAQSPFDNNGLNFQQCANNPYLLPAQRVLCGYPYNQQFGQQFWEQQYWNRRFFYRQYNYYRPPFGYRPYYNYPYQRYR